MSPATNSRGSVAVREPSKSPLRWIIPVAIALILILAALTALVLLNLNDDNDDDGLDVRDDAHGLVVPIDAAA
jgi:hypothetical protein